MKVLRHAVTLTLVFLLASPTFGVSDSIGQTIFSQAASVHSTPLTTGSTLLNGETVTVQEKGIARFALSGGSQIEVLDQSSVRFVRNQSTVQLMLQSGGASFRSEPTASVEALIADATVRSLPAKPAVGLVSFEKPDSVLVVATKGALQIATLHDGRTVDIPEGSAARLSLVPDPQGGAAPAGRSTGIGIASGTKLAIIALIIGGAAIVTGLILAHREHEQSNVGNEVSPFRIN